MVLLAGILLTGCGAGGGNSKKNASNSTGFLIYGIASKGPIKVGFVTVHALDTTGTPGGLLGTTITADDGSYAVDIGTYTGNILVEVKKGTYIDEATKVVKTNESMRAAVTQVKGSAVVMVTPFTEIAVRKAGTLTTDNIENANALAGTMAGGADIIGTRPANVLNAEECANAASYEIDYGLALASLSGMANGNIQDAMAKISEDLKDGKLNDHGVHLKDSLLAFLNNPNNQSGVTDPGQIEIDEATGNISRLGALIGKADHAFGPECLIFPGFGDIHVHCREDETGKQSHKEDYSTAAQAAMHGGVCFIGAMPNTPSPLLTSSQLQWHRNRCKNLPIHILHYVGIGPGTAPIAEHVPYKVFTGPSIGQLFFKDRQSLHNALSHYRGNHISFHVEDFDILEMSKNAKTHDQRRPRECVEKALSYVLEIIGEYKKIHRQK